MIINFDKEDLINNNIMIIITRCFKEDFDKNDSIISWLIDINFGKESLIMRRFNEIIILKAFNKNDIGVNNNW